MSDEACGNCRFFRPPPPDASAPDDGRGICAIAPVRVLATIIDDGRVNVVSGWPPAFPTMWSAQNMRP